MSDTTSILVKERQKRFKNALFNASLLHIVVGLYRLIIVPILARTEGGYGLFVNRLRYHRVEDDRGLTASEYRQYAIFILIYGVVLGLYNALGTYRMQKLAV